MEKQKGQILLLALLPFHYSGAGTVLLHKRKRNKEHCLSVQQATAQGELPGEKPPGQRMHRPRWKTCCHAASCAQTQDLEPLWQQVRAGRCSSSTISLLPCICFRNHLLKTKQPPNIQDIYGLWPPQEVYLQSRHKVLWSFITSKQVFLLGRNLSVYKVNVIFTIIPGNVSEEQRGSPAQSVKPSWCLSPPACAHSSCCTSHYQLHTLCSPGNN